MSSRESRHLVHACSANGGSTAGGNPVARTGADGDNGRMFDRSARWYDAFYADVDYGAEAEQVTSIIRELNPAASSLLDVACGTGRHLVRGR